MLGNEELLFDEIYEKTKDCGRVQFVKLLMTKERENQELKKQVEETEKCLKDMYHINIENDKELDKLKTQLEEYKQENKKLAEDKLEYLTTYGKMLSSQDRFIKYLEDEIEKKKKKSTSLKAFVRNVVPLKHALQKYKEIVGVSDENNTSL